MLQKDIFNESKFKTWNRIEIKVERGKIALLVNTSNCALFIEEFLHPKVIRQNVF